MSDDTAIAITVMTQVGMPPNGHPFDATLFARASAPEGVGSGASPPTVQHTAGRSSDRSVDIDRFEAQQQLTAPACVGLNLFVRWPSGEPALLLPLIWMASRGLLSPSLTFTRLLSGAPAKWRASDGQPPRSTE